MLSQFHCGDSLKDVAATLNLSVFSFHLPLQTCIYLRFSRSLTLSVSFLDYFANRFLRYINIPRSLLLSCLIVLEIFLRAAAVELSAAAGGIISGAISQLASSKVDIAKVRSIYSRIIIAIDFES